jgi:hypothetical protein
MTADERRTWLARRSAMIWRARAIDRKSFRFIAAELGMRTQRVRTLFNEAQRIADAYLHRASEAADRDTC